MIALQRRREHRASTFIYLLFISGCAGSSLLCSEAISLVTVTGGYSLVVVHGLLIALASLVAEHGLWGTWASVAVSYRLSSCGSQSLECSSVVVADRLSCPKTYGIFPHQGSHLCPLHW